MGRKASLWGTDCLSKTAHLSLSALGAHTRMLQHARMSPDRSLPNDDIYLARITGAGRLWKHLKPEIMTLWTVNALSKLNYAPLSPTSNSSKASKTEAYQKINGTKCTAKKANSEKIASLEKDIAAAFEAWNEVARKHGLSVADKLSHRRKSQLRARLAEYGLAGWMTALEKVAKSPFLLGQTANRDGRWRGAYLDFLLQDSSFLKLMEGFYDDKRNGRTATPYRNGFYGDGPSIGDFFEPALGGGSTSQTGDAIPHSRSEIVIEASRGSDPAGS